MNFARKIKILIIIIFVLFTTMLAIIGIAPWVCEPRQYIKEDEFLMSIHPFTQCLLSATALILWIPVLKYGIKGFRLCHEADKRIRNSEKLEK